MLPTNKCSGCTACMVGCPVQCIHMKPDMDGFLYPHIQADVCLHCGKCERICPVLNNTREDTLLPVAYAAKNKDAGIKAHSSSGGVFSALAEDTISRGGAVFGARLTEILTVEHCMVESVQELASLRGSKYVSSQLGDCFRQVREQLNAGRPVLFSGTPCQVEGVLAFLNRPYDNLLTADLICHGVPSAKVWTAYCAEREAKQNARITFASFRNKDRGWKQFSMKLEFDNGAVYRSSLQEDPFLRAFLTNLCLRPSCHDCVFKSKNRKSDITLADFWGVQQIMPQEDDDQGVSLVLAHSEKGKKALRRLEESVTLLPTDLEPAIERNRAMVRSVTPHHFRDYFFHRLGKVGFDKLVEQCFSPSYPVRLHRKILQKLGK